MEWLEAMSILCETTGWLAQVLKRCLTVREVHGSILVPVKSDAVAPPLGRFFGAVLPRR